MAALILVIDDSGTVRTIMAASFQRIGVQAATFADGVQAMRALSCGEMPLPDAMLIDVQLPKLDGFAVVKRFRQHPALAQVPIFMLSGNGSLVQKLRAWRAGANGYLTKPFHPQEVMAVLGQRLGWPQRHLPASMGQLAAGGRRH